MRDFTVLIHPDEGQEARLSAAIILTRTFRGRLTCVQVTPFSYFLGGDPLAGYATVPLTIDAESERQAEIRATIEARLTREHIEFEWRHVDGDPASCLVRAAPLQDLIILSIPLRRMEPYDPIPTVGDVAINARAPVLAVPKDRSAFNADGTAVVAWNGSAECAHALRFAVPMLQRAAAVHIIVVGEDGSAFPAADAASYLARYDIRATLHEIAREGRAVADAILSAASGLDADYLVMGAYGHTRLREYVLGGVTRTALRDSPIPLLLAH